MESSVQPIVDRLLDFVLARYQFMETRLMTRLDDLEARLEALRLAVVEVDNRVEDLHDFIRNDEGISVDAKARLDAKLDEIDEALAKVVTDDETTPPPV